MPEAAEHLDILLRLDATAAPELLKEAVPLLRDDAFRRALAARLARHPQWRALLPAALLQSSDPAVAEALLAQVAASGASPAEIAARTQLLERIGRPQAARAHWRSTLSSNLQRLDRGVFDGGFEHGAGPAPYGWKFESQGGTVVGIDAASAWRGRQSLAIVFDGRAIDFTGVSQDMTLVPGTHRLRLRAKIALRGSRPLAWVMACRPSETPVVRLEMPSATGDWRQFEEVFHVPGGCVMQRLQMLSLGRNLTERQVAGEVRFDALSIEPVHAFEATH